MRFEDMLEEQDNGDYRVLFGAHEGRLLSTLCLIDYEYVDWMIFKSELPVLVREAAADVLEKWENGDL